MSIATTGRRDGNSVQRTPKDVRAWLRRRPSLGEMQEAYGQEWERVEAELSEVIGRNSLAELEQYVASLSSPAAAQPGRDRPQRKVDARLSVEIRRQMAAAALKQLSVAAATGVSGARLRFNLVNGWVAQRLLFARGLERKPVSLFWFRLLWPLVWQRKRLMPLVQPKGIYCFYSGKLISELAALIGDRSCLEIAAGDGTLSRFLQAGGVSVTASDDHSWEHNIAYSENVLRQDARTALRTHQPEVVICSWPPAGNEFERDVFATDSVQLYVVINSALEIGSGNRSVYLEQQRFEAADRPGLSQLVLPPELEARVQVFERTSP